MKIFNSTILFVAALMACAVAPMQMKADYSITVGETPILINGIECNEIIIDCDDFVMTIAMPGKIQTEKKYAGAVINGMLNDNDYRITVLPECLSTRLTRWTIGLEKLMVTSLNQEGFKLAKLEASPVPFTSCYEGYYFDPEVKSFARLLYSSNVGAVAFTLDGDKELDESLSTHFLENMTIIPKSFRAN